MGSYALLNSSGSPVGETELKDEVFFVPLHREVIQQALRGQLRGKRMGTASTKTRSEVSGGGRKPWRQKGTGRARHGSIRSPLWVGGGITFGPKPKNYQNRTPKKMKSLALRSVLSQLIQGEACTILEDLRFFEPKTKQMVGLLEDLGIEDRKVLILLEEKDDSIYKSGRNLPLVKVLPVSGINIYDLLNTDHLLLTQGAKTRLEEVLSP